VDITVKAKCEVPPRVRATATRRVAHAARFLDRLLSVEVVFATEGVDRPALVELTGRTKRERIRVEGRGSDHRAAVDVAVARFERQLARHTARSRTRTRARPRTASLPLPPPAPALAPHLAPADQEPPDGA
jgi:ribosomal subunit interface protein